MQLSADGRVVVYHDYRLNPGYTRLRDGDWLDGVTPRIKDLTWEQLQRYNIGLPKPGSDYARAHPLLRDADGDGRFRSMLALNPSDEALPRWPEWR